MADPRDRRIVFVAYDDAQGLDLVGPLEVFAAASEAAGERGLDGYDLTVATVDGGPFTTSGGLRMEAHAALADVRGPLDTLMAVGGEGTRGAIADPALIAALARVAGEAGRVTSVCSGAFLLAAAGLLDGKRATTHWSVCDILAETFPQVSVEPDPIYIRDGDTWTSAGVTAGMDLALALVEDDLGRDLALAVARRLVLFLHRPANQAQFSAHLSAQLADRDAIREVQHHIAEHPDADLTVEALAHRAAMSPRHFARVFAAEVGTTPARYVETVRVEAARRRLEESDDAVEAIARSCGFGTAETMRRAFLRVLDANPTEYRRRFRVA